MIIRKNLLIVILLLSILNLFSCKEKCKTEYLIQFPVTLYPQNDTFNIGDTIFVEWAYDAKHLLDRNSNMLVEHNDFDFLLEMLFAKYNSSSIEDGIDNFQFGSQQGEIKKTQLVTISFLDLDFELVDGMRKGKYYFIPQQEGNFYFVFNSHKSLTSIDVDFIDFECIEYLEVDYNLNNGTTETNFEYFDANSPEHRDTKESSLKDGFYAFVVIP